MKITTTKEYTKSENIDAKKYWSTTDFQRKEYPKKLPLYASTLRDLIYLSESKRVFEFGCNAGRNMKLLRDNSPNLYLSGVDINQASIDYGTQKWELPIKLGHEGYLESLHDNSFDLIFTVSVLDHIPDIEPICSNFNRISGEFIILVEPIATSTGKVLNFENEKGERIDATPYSYIHDYPKIMESVGCKLVSQYSIPPYKGNLGPLYNFMLFRVKRRLPSYWLPRTYKKMTQLIKSNSDTH